MTIEAISGRHFITHAENEVRARRLAADRWNNTRADVTRHGAVTSEDLALLCEAISAVRAERWLEAVIDGRPDDELAAAVIRMDAAADHHRTGSLYWRDLAAALSRRA